MRSAESATPSVNPPGIEGRRVYVDSIHEAQERAARAKAGGKKRPRQPRRQMVDLATRQLRDCERLQRLMRAEIAALEKPDPITKQKGVPTTAQLKAFDIVTKSITNLMEQVRRTRSSELAQLGGLSDEQLAEVLRLHLPRLAQGMPDADRRVILATWFGEDIADVLLNPRAVTT